MSQKSVVVMPTCSRPEFLALALEKLSQTPESEALDVRIYLDCSCTERLDEVDYVRKTYLPTAGVYLANEHPVAPSGTWNILNALKAGYETGAEYIFLVEEDVMVYPDFFSWHLSAQASGNYFATCGRLRSQYKSDHYTNPGSCFRRDKLAEVVEYITPEFFQDRRGFMDRQFGQMDEASDLDDGLVRRVIRYVGGEVKYPDRPVCAHQGFRYYNQFVQFKTEGEIADRVSQLRQMLQSINPNDRYSKDFEPYTPEV